MKLVDLMHGGKMKHIFKICTLLGLLTAATPALADDPVSIGAFDDWEAFSYNSDGAPVCYVFSSPKKSESDKKINKRDPVYFMITHFPGRKVKGQVSNIIGYPFKESSVVALNIDENQFELYTNGDTAWAAANEVEAAIVKAMRAGKSLTVTGTSWKNTKTTDTYSLIGINKSLEKIDAACN